MAKFLELLGLMPKSVQIAIAGILIGGAAFAAHEMRYMTVGQFTKSYVLDIKSEIRQIQKDLSDEELDARVRDMLEEQLAFLLDDLCYETPDDPYCEVPDEL
jgi:hypothetical protein